MPRVGAVNDAGGEPPRALDDDAHLLGGGRQGHRESAERLQANSLLRSPRRLPRRRRGSRVPAQMV